MNKYTRLVATALILVVALTALPINAMAVDRITDYKFILDVDSVGEWEIYDYFSADKMEYTDRSFEGYRGGNNVYPKEALKYTGISIYEDGTMEVHSRNQSPKICRWTTGYMEWNSRQTFSAYRIKNIGSFQIMFVENFSDDLAKSPDGCYIFKGSFSKANISIASRQQHIGIEQQYTRSPSTSPMNNFNPTVHTL